MKQIIVKTRLQAIRFAEGGNRHSQRAAYWMERGKAHRAECLPGEKTALVRENCGGLWWSATKTIAKKLGI